MELEQLKNILEAVLMATEEPLNEERLLKLFQEYECPTLLQLREALNELTIDYQARGVELIQVATGFRFQSRSDYSGWVSRLWQEKPPRYSRALLETLAIIAYQQPITRAEIEDIRGVSVSTTLVKTLLDHQWVHVVGQRDVPGKPSIYATTRYFLDYFNLKKLTELPPLKELKESMQEMDATLLADMTEQLSLPEVAEAPAAVETVDSATAFISEEVTEEIVETV